MDIEDLRTNFVAVLTSGGGRLGERQFINDYRSLVGENIPYRQLGHNNVISLLNSMGGFYITKSGGEDIINAGFDPKTAHISALISRQKKKPTKRRSSSYGRPKLPQKLPQLKRTPIPPYSSAPRRTHAYTPRPQSHVPQRQPLPHNTSYPTRQAPPPKYGNPPIIPQRQSLSSLVERTDSVNLKTSAQDRLVSKPTQAEESVEGPPTTFVDIQWLPGIIREKAKPVKTYIPLKPGKIPSLMSLEVASPPAKSPAADYCAPVLTQPPDRNTYPAANAKPKSSKKMTQEDHLRAIVDELKMGSIEFKYVERKPTRGKAVFIAKVKIGDDFNISSYPDEQPSCEEAKELVCKLAMEELSKRPKPKESAVENIELLLRVYEIIKTKTNGMIENGIANEYLNIYKISLPSNWLEIVEGSPFFSVEQPGGLGKAVVYPLQKPSQSPKVQFKIPDNLHNFRNDKLCKDINSNTVIHTLSPSKPEIVHRIPELVLPKDETWDCFVSTVSTNEIWIRLIGTDYDDKYDEVMTNLELKMMSSNCSVNNPIINEFYAVEFNNCWARVELKEITDEDCYVYLIDNGEYDTVPVSDLRVLDRKFLNLPPQAVKCHLAYCSDLSSSEAQAYLMNNVIGRSFVAEVLPPISSGSTPTIVLHNTEVEGEPINVNVRLLDEIIRKFERPCLSVRHVNFVSLTHIEEKSPPIVQIKSKELDILNNILSDLSRQDLVRTFGLNAHPSVGHRNKHMFLVRSARAPKLWRRATISNNDDPRNPTMLMVDFGYTERLMVSDIFDLEKVMPPLCKFPVQAVEINLTNISKEQLVPGVVKRLQELLPPDVFILGKVTEQGGGATLPCVEFFKRVQPDNMICSVNSDIVFNFEEYSKMVEPPKVVPQPISNGISSASTKPLSPYPIPPVNNEYFDVHVSMSSNPDNFFVQPLQDQALFHGMMSEMQDHYENTYHIMPTPSAENLCSNATFAAKHPTDLQWYRVSMVEMVSPTMYSVRYSDYGDVGVVSPDRIRYLDPKFHTLPIQAIRAKLSGIMPNNLDWSEEESSAFIKTVDDRSFVSIITDVNAESSVNKWKISLQLIDTSQDGVDIDIAEKLISAGYALRKS